MLKNKKNIVKRIFSKREKNYIDERAIRNTRAIQKGKDIKDTAGLKEPMPEKERRMIKQIERKMSIALRDLVMTSIAGIHLKGDPSIQATMTNIFLGINAEMLTKKKKSKLIEYANL